MTTEGVPVHCIEFVEMVTDYLSGVLAPDVVAAVDGHLVECPGCVSVLDQFRVTIRQLGHIRVADVEALDPGIRRQLIEAFGAWSAARRTDD